MAPVCAALPRNTHLRVLHCSVNRMSAAFARDVLLPAVRANGSLLQLVAGTERIGDPSLEEAVAHVAARAAVALADDVDA
jgi:hypothetical protein